MVHIGFQLRHLVRVGAEEGVLADRLPALEGNLDRTQLAHIATHSNALAGKILARNGAGRDPHRSLPGGGAPTATVVARAVLVVIAVVRMGRTEQVLDRRVVLGLLIGIADQQTDRAAGGAPLEHPGEDLHLVRLLTLGGMAAGARLAPVQVRLQVGGSQLQPRRAAIDDGNQCRAMAFACSGDGEQGTKGVSGHACHPFQISERQAV